MGSTTETQNKDPLYAAQRLGRMLSLPNSGFYGIDTMEGLKVGVETEKFHAFVMANWEQISKLAHMIHDGDRRKAERRKS